MSRQSRICFFFSVGSHVLVLFLQDFAHFLVLLQFVLVAVVAQGTAPAVQIVVHQVVVGFQLFPALLPQIQFLAVIEVAPHCEYLVLEFDCFVAEVSAFGHFLEMHHFMGVDVELEHLLIETFAPPATQNVDEPALGHCCCVGEGEIKFAGEDRPLVGLGGVHLNCRQPFLAVVATKNVYFSAADYGSEGAARGVQPFDGSPLLPEYIVGLAARHSFIFSVVPADHIDLTVEVHAGVLFSGIQHWPFFIQCVLFPGAVEVALTGGASAGDENLASGEGAGRGVVLDLAVVDGGQTVAARQRAQSQNFFALPEKTDARGYLVADLNESFLSGEGHYQYWELDDCWFAVFPHGGFLDSQVFFCFFLPFYSFELLHHSGPFFGVVLQICGQLSFLCFQFFHFLFQELGEILFGPVVLIDESGFDEVEDPIQLFCGFLVAAEKFLFDVAVVALVFLQGLPISVQPGYLAGQFLLSDEKVGVLFQEVVTRVLGDALHADVFIVGFAVKFEGFVVD